MNYENLLDDANDSGITLDEKYTFDSRLKGL